MALRIWVIRKPASFANPDMQPIRPLPRAFVRKTACRAWPEPGLQELVVGAWAWPEPGLQELVVGAWAAYSHSLEIDPLPTKMLTAASLVTLGDAMSQITEPDGRYLAYDVQRSLSFAIFGAVYTGAFQHWWFIALNEIVPVPPDATDAQLWVAAATKTALCQFGTIPLVYLPLFFLLTGAMRALSPEQSWSRACSLYIPLLKRNVSYWIPVQMAQFLFVDPCWQVPYVCLAGFVWSLILSRLTGPTIEACTESDSPTPMLKLVETTISPES